MSWPGQTGSQKWTRGIHATTRNSAILAWRLCHRWPEWPLVTDAAFSAPVLSSCRVAGGKFVRLSTQYCSVDSSTGGRGTGAEEGRWREDREETWGVDGVASRC